MAFSGGTFSRTFDCTTDRDNGVKILASKFDTELDGMATGLSTCILKDGTQTCTAAIPFAEGLTVPDNKTIVLGTNSDITIQYDESTNDSLEIAANVEGAALGIVLKADQGDDNADQHKVNIADGGTLTMASKISGSFVSYLTHTPNSTVASSTTAVAGNLTVGGDLTLGSGAVISEAELEAIDGVTAGTVTASKAVVVDSNKDIASFRNVTLTGELDAGSLDVSGDADIDGTLEADAMTLNGTAITATATLDTGISNNNVPKFTSGVADNDFLRVDGTAIEGRSASEVLSDIAAAPAAGSSNIVTTGALNSGSITSGFGSIDNGSSAITTTGVITGGTLEATADTSAGDNAAIGFTSAEGLILTGQGSTSDITVKNDADSTVFTVPTGTDDILFPDDAKILMGADSDLQIYHDGSNSFIDDAGTGNVFLRGSSQVIIGNMTGEQAAVFNDNGAVTINYDNAQKLATTSSGIDITGNVTATGTVSGASALSHRNLIINGAMQVAQRGGSATTVSSSTETFSVDRFFGRGVGSAGVFTVEQSTTSPEGFLNSSKVTVTTADSSIGATNAYQFTQRIEGQNSYWLDWGNSSAKTVTLSFYVRSSLTGTFGGCIRNSAFNRFHPFSYSISSADTWEEKTIVIVGDTTGTWLTTNGIGVEVAFSLGAGSSRLNTAGSWTASTSEGASGQVNLISTNSSTWYITGVQLEVGEQATPFEHRSFGDELALCKRYFETSYPYGTAPGSASGGIGSDHRYVGRNTPQNYGWYSQRYTVEKRAAPTVTIFGYDGTSGQVSNGDSGSNIGAAGVIQNGTTGFLPRNESGGTLNEQAVIFLYSADAEL